MSDTAPVPILCTHEITRRFGAVQALHGVSIDLFPGEVHGIIGENGAGKSTLMKILSGVDRPDAGHLTFHGKKITLKRPIDAQRLGISMIHQELNLVDELSVADNLFLGRERSFAGFVRRRKTNRLARNLLAKVHSTLSPTTKVRKLSIAQKQMVEIAKTISTSASVLIMDEPTAVLSRREVSALFEIIAELKQARVAIVYISHILPEVLQLSDRITVMRDGSVVETMQRDFAVEIGERGLASKMVGRPMADHFPKKRGHFHDFALEVRGLSVPGVLQDLTFNIRHGEILGFAGLIGAGRTEMAEAIVGLRKKAAGEITIDAKEVKIEKLQDAIDAGIGYLSEDRKGSGLTIGMSIVANITLVSLRRYTRLLINRREELKAAHRYVHDLSIKAGSIKDDVGSLSGGNQQKVALAKWLEIHPKLLIIDEPTRGVDIGAKEHIYKVIQSLTAGGMACILISSELNEVIGLSHRIAVMRNGRIATILNADHATEALIMQHAAGVELKATA